MTTPVTPAEVEALEALLASLCIERGGEYGYATCLRVAEAAIHSRPAADTAALRARDAGVERALRECAYEALSRWEGSRRDAGRVCEIIDAAIAAGVAALKSSGGGA